MQRLFDDYLVFVFRGSCGHGYAYPVNLDEAIAIAVSWQRTEGLRWRPYGRATVYLDNADDHPDLLEYARSLGVDCFFGIPVYVTIEGKLTHAPQP